MRREHVEPHRTPCLALPIDAEPADLYSAAPLNTFGEPGRSMIRTAETGRMGRDTPRLYALYSFVFRRRMHTNSARKPYSRKAFEICIQCIQRIPTPPLFGFSLLLGREYMNTPNTIAGLRASGVAGVHAAHSDRFVFSRSTEYGSTGRRNRAANGGNGANRPRHAPVVCIVFSCIQTPSAYKFGL